MFWNDDPGDQADEEEERSTWDPYGNDEHDYPEPSEDIPDPYDNEPDAIGDDGMDDD